MPTRISHASPRRTRRVRATLASALLGGVALPGLAQSAREAGAVTGAVTGAEFAALRWLEGSWRGRLPDGGFFYERYTMVDDSTIEMRRLADSTLVPAGAPAPIALRGGVVRYDGATATRLGPAEVAFTPPAPARGGFAFRRTGADAWTATIRNVGAGGGERVVVYEMVRATPPRTPAASDGSAAAQGGDRAAVRRAVLDYVEGFYEGDTAKLARSVWPQVRKYGYGRGGASGAYEGSEMTFPTGFMRYANGVRAGRGGPPPNAPKEITLFDVQDQTASAKLTAWWGTDYLLLARENGRWMITHVLWQSRPPARAGRSD
jgi:hypothetical protein